MCAYLRHGQFLSRNRTCQAMSELFGLLLTCGVYIGNDGMGVPGRGGPAEGAGAVLGQPPIRVLFEHVMLAA